MDTSNQKPPELVQAQVAAYAAEIIEDHNDRAHIFSNIGSIATEHPQDVIRTTKRAEYIRDESGEYERIPEDTDRLAASADGYLKYLRSVGGARHESIRGRVKILSNYQGFAGEIDALKQELSDPAIRQEHPNLLGSGSNSMVFSLEHDGADYVVRVPRGSRSNPAAIDSHLAGAVLGQGMPHLEQIVAASYEDGVTVAERMPGKEVGQLSPEEIRQVSDAQLADFVDTLITANQRGIEIDPKPSNFLYDPESGFGIVDYHSSKVQKNSADQKLVEVVGWGTSPIDNAGFYGKPYKSEKTAQDYASDLEYKNANLDVLRRYRSIVAEKLQDEEREAVLKNIDEKAQSLEEAVQNYSNPDWVEDRIAQEEEWRRQRAKQASERPASSDDWISLDVMEV